MRTIGRRAALVLAALAVGGALSSCGRFFESAQVPEEQREEVFEFDIEPGTMNPAEAEQAIIDQIAPDRIVPGSATHRGSVTAPGGRADFFTYRMIDPGMGSQAGFCTSIVADFTMSAGCGDQPPPLPVEPIQIDGESWGGPWRTAEFSVQADVARIEATAVDGTVYTLRPLNGFGYIEWLDERGSLELVAYDADGKELGRTFAGLDR